jgi:hypothetical protein
MLSSDAWPLFVFFLGLMLVAVLIESVVFAFVVNLVTRSPVHLYLLSSALVGIFAFASAMALMMLVPGPHVSYNGKPVSFKAWIVYNQLWISEITIIAFLALWQVFVRNRKQSAARWF